MFAYLLFILQQAFFDFPRKFLIFQLIRNAGGYPAQTPGFRAEEIRFPQNGVPIDLLSGAQEQFGRCVNPGDPGKRIVSEPCFRKQGPGRIQRFRGQSRIEFFQYPGDCRQMRRDHEFAKRVILRKDPAVVPVTGNPGCHIGRITQHYILSQPGRDDSSVKPAERLPAAQD